MADHARSRGRLWLSWSGLVAVLLLCAQFAWRGHYLWNGFYFQDDFNMLRLAGENDLTWSYLMQEYAGHVWPGNFLIAWVTARVEPTSWVLTATFVLLLQMACGAMMWAVLSRISQDWRIRIPVLVAYLVTPLTLWATQWWASAIGFVPLSLFMLVAAWGLIRRIQDDWRPGSVVVVLALLTGLTFQERALLYTVLLGGIAVVMTEGTLGRRILLALRTYWRLWVGVLVVVGGWMALHSVQAPIEVSDSGEGRSPWTLLRDFLFRSLLPGLAGGPWGSAAREEGAQGVLVPTDAASIVGSAITLTFLALIAWRTRRSGRLALLLVLVYALGDLVIIFGGRTQYEGAFGLVQRYVADVAPVACIGVAFALADIRVRRVTRVRTTSFRRRWRGPYLVVVATLSYVVSSVWTTAVIAPFEQGKASRAYVETIRAEIRANPTGVIYDRLVPHDVMIGWFEDAGRVSTVLAHAPESPVYSVMSEELLVPDASGRLVEPELAFTRDLDPPARLGECGYRVEELAPPARVPLDDGPLPAWYVLRLSYFTGSESLVTVHLDGRPHSFLAQEGVNTAYLVADRDSEEVEIELEEGEGVVCVTGILAGFPSEALQ